MWQLYLHLVFPLLPWNHGCSCLYRVRRYVFLVKLSYQFSCKLPMSPLFHLHEVYSLLQWQKNVFSFLFKVSQIHGSRSDLWGSCSSGWTPWFSCPSSKWPKGGCVVSSHHSVGSLTGMSTYHMCLLSACFDVYTFHLKQCAKSWLVKKRSIWKWMLWRFLTKDQLGFICIWF